MLANSFCDSDQPRRRPLLDGTMLRAVDGGTQECEWLARFDAVLTTLPSGGHHPCLRQVERYDRFKKQAVSCRRGGPFA